jgi:hypothetical protein
VWNLGIVRRFPSSKKHRQCMLVALTRSSQCSGCVMPGQLVCMQDTDASTLMQVPLEIKPFVLNSTEPYSICGVSCQPTHPIFSMTLQSYQSNPPTASHRHESFTANQEGWPPRFGKAEKGSFISCNRRPRTLSGNLELDPG